MKDKELIVCLQEYIEAHKKLAEQEELLGSIIGLSYEGSFSMAIDALDKAYMTLLNSSGSPFYGGWLEWFIYENEYGKQGLEAGTKGNMKKIKTLEDLVWVMKDRKGIK